ncbi:hypothetical protein TanjilG_19215 [Lupinus angustifolius]|uniref:Uncharacterized protein n=1 Tax=Lupinus angustifolius TaxID=3871 RepID=A0A1J7IE82_LUPAN|nr:hypothetical protein TanjilG_19215 [Lupinus angustifolius]
MPKQVKLVPEQINLLINEVGVNAPSKGHGVPSLTAHAPTLGSNCVLMQAKIVGAESLTEETRTKAKVADVECLIEEAETDARILTKKVEVGLIRSRHPRPKPSDRVILVTTNDTFKDHLTEVSWPRFPTMPHQA